jgi:ribosomal protein S18 acetylase RimI-like enzyme
VLEVCYDGSELVGCSTVRPPSASSAVTVIVRILPAYRRRGFGEVLYRRALARARELGGGSIETIVLASNVEGLAFAQAHGFVEYERDLLPGHTIPFVALRL